MSPKNAILISDATRDDLRRWKPMTHISAAAALVLAAGGTIAQDCDNDSIPDALQTYRWKATGPGFWGGNNNWQGPTSTAPGQNDLALFDGSDGLGAPPYFAFMDGFAPVSGLGVLDCDATINLGSSVMSVGGDIADCREFLLGGGLGAQLTLVGGGQFRINRAVLADQPMSAATLIVDGQSGRIELRHLNPAPIIVGQRGSGKIELIDAEFVHDGPLILGGQAGSDGAVIAYGTTDVLWSAEVASDVSVGFLGGGVLSFNDDTVIDSNSPFALRVGVRTTGTGEVGFVGLVQPQSFLVSDLEIGVLGSGFWQVRQGTDVVTQVTARAVLGLDPGSLGVAEIMDFSHWGLAGVPLEIGPGGRADLRIGEGSSVDSSLGIRAFVDGVVEGSGALAGGLDLIGGEIRPTDEYAETAGRQVLDIDGDLAFFGTNPQSGLFETGRMTYTLISDDPQESMSAMVTGTAALGGTLRIIIPQGVSPDPAEKYPVVESQTLTGEFDAVQTPVLGGKLIAVPTYDGQGDANIEFIGAEVPESVLGLTQNLVVPGDIVDAVVTDVNDDGFPDLVTLASNGAGQNGQIRVAFNQGVTPAGGWLGFSQGPAVFDSLGDLPKSIAVGDMNGDSSPDIVVMNRGPASGQVRIRLNSQVLPGDFSQVDQRIISVNGEPADIALADISGNGLLDVITVFDRASRGASDGGIQVSENDGGGFDDSEGDTGDDPGSVDTMGGEAMPSGVAVSSKGTDSMHLYATGLLNRGTTFPLFLLQEVPAGRDPDSIFTADLTGDGLDDVIASDGVSGTISVLVAQDFGEIVYSDAISLNAGPTAFGAAPGSVVVLDVNEDNRPDIVFTARDAQNQVGVRTILNLGKGDAGERLFSDSIPLAQADGNTPRVLAVADLDQDGQEDLVVVRAPSSGPTVSSLTVPGPLACNAADLSVPLGVLDLADVNAFIVAFTTQDPIADLAPPSGVFDLTDLSAFITAFVAGCP